MSDFRDLEINHDHRHELEEFANESLLENDQENRDEDSHFGAYLYFSYFLFLLFGIATTIVWFALTTSVSQLFTLFGSEIFLLLLLAHNLPAAPILFLQILFDEKINYIFDPYRSFWFKMSLMSFLELICGVVLIVTYYLDCLNKIIIVTVSVLLGVHQCYSYGMCTNLSGIFPPNCINYYFLGNSVAPLILFAFTAAWPYFGIVFI